MPSILEPTQASAATAVTAGAVPVQYGFREVSFGEALVGFDIAYIGNLGRSESVHFQATLERMTPMGAPVVPEPASMALFALGAAGVLGLRRRAR